MRNRIELSMFKTVSKQLPEMITGKWETLRTGFHMEKPVEIIQIRKKTSIITLNVPGLNSPSKT
jgi:hypothetical protein